MFDVPSLARIALTDGMGNHTGLCAPNLGKTLPGGKNIQPSLILQDAYAEVRVADALLIDAGLMFIPFSRNSLQSAATLPPVDYGASTFSDSAVEQSTTGRDTGFQVRGYLAGNRIEYRIGAFQGARDAGSGNAFRYAGRVEYNALDPQSGFFYAGTMLPTLPKQDDILVEAGYWIRALKLTPVLQIR